MSSRKQLIILLLFISLGIYLAAISLHSCKQKNSSDTPPALSGNNSFVGPETCRTCHEKEYNEWLASDHYRAMMVANDTTVAGDFNEASYKADGITSRFFKRGEKFFINTEGEDGRNHDYEVKYTFGYYPLQQYLVEFPGGRMQVPRVSYDVVKKKWFHQYSGQIIDHSDWLHWTRQSQNWNSMCASCHSTGLQRNYDEERNSYHTTFSHLTVSCESCHGMGKHHMEYINTTSYQKGKKVAGSYLLLNKEANNKQQLSGCVQCHARRMEVAADMIHSSEVLDNFIPTLPTTENYFADGQFREEDYEFGSFTQSKMYHRGVKCSNCHNPHTGKTIAAGNKLCLQCHQPKYDAATHHFHTVNTAGAECISCHMPSRIYMGNDVRHDHSFRVPRPDQSVKYAVPNACNKCHENKSSQWAADAIVKWYGPTRRVHYSDDLIPGSLLDDNAFIHLNRLLHDTSVTEIIRAAAVNYMGNIITEERISAIRKCLHDSSAMVRNEAAAALLSFPTQSWLSDALPLLKDPVRAVRATAANALFGIPQETLGNEHLSAYEKAGAEWKQMMHHHADFPTGNLMLADYYYRAQDYVLAEKYFLRCLQMDSLANYARINLSGVYNATGQNNKALAVLKQALKIDPDNATIHYRLALLQVELNNKTEAIKYFELAYRLQYDNDRFYYNYALYLQQLGSTAKAAHLFNEGLRRYPNSEQLNYGAAYFYLQTSQQEKAAACINKLKSLNPDNPQYSELFQLLN
ncbi:MAG: tetratricopeptide repeat protein [Chitinophagales bacterium]|nr:tetratricopeptide repeat protein [Chitinophagales bacterium]